jgi:prevent-host-death family protein
LQDGYLFEVAAVLLTKQPVSTLLRRLDRSIRLTYDIAYERKWRMTTLTATEARKSLYGLLDDVADSHMSVQITGKRNSAVLVSKDDWQAIQETLFLTAIPGMRKSIQSGMRTPVCKCDKELKW